MNLREDKGIQNARGLFFLSLFILVVCQFMPLRDGSAHRGWEMWVRMPGDLRATLTVFDPIAIRDTASCLSAAAVVLSAPFLVTSFARSRALLMTALFIGIGAQILLLFSMGAPGHLEGAQLLFIPLLVTNLGLFRLHTVPRQAARI